VLFLFALSLSPKIVIALPDLPLGDQTGRKRKKKEHEKEVDDEEDDANCVICQ
jgi:hypothetical protein